MATLANPQALFRNAVMSLRTQALIPASAPPAIPSSRTQHTLSKAISSSLPASEATCSNHKKTILTLVRFASSSSSPDSTAQIAPPPPPSHTLNWNEYLSLRRKRRRYNLVSSISTSLLTTAAGVTVLNQNFETVGNLSSGLDPFITLGFATASAAGIGWLSGPILGSAVFNLAHRRVKKDMQEKERDFYHRIRRHRVDPSSQSMSNPVPDYYGEKIGSVADFRNWMKDQRAYNKKRQFT